METIFDEESFERVQNQIFDELELNVLDNMGPARLLAATIGFSVKESIFKAFYPLVGRYFGFSSVTLESVDLERQCIGLNFAPWLSGLLPGDTVVNSYFSSSGRYVVTQVSAQVQEVVRPE